MASSSFYRVGDAFTPTDMSEEKNNIQAFLNSAVKSFREFEEIEYAKFTNRDMALASFIIRALVNRENEKGHEVAQEIINRRLIYGADYEPKHDKYPGYLRIDFCLDNGENISEMYRISWKQWNEMQNMLWKK